MFLYGSLLGQYTNFSKNRRYISLNGKKPKSDQNPIGTFLTMDIAYTITGVNRTTNQSN